MMNVALNQGRKLSLCLIIVFYLLNLLIKCNTLSLSFSLSLMILLLQAVFNLNFVNFSSLSIKT